MIPDIGVMVGAYITMRCFDVLCRPETAFSSKGTRATMQVSALLVMVVTLVVVYDLVTRGSSIGTVPGLR
jgi:hypothetical protein